MGGRDIDWAEHYLAGCLHEYLGQAYQAGEANATEILAETSKELLANHRVMWERVERKARL